MNSKVEKLNTFSISGLNRKAKVVQNSNSLSSESKINP